MAVGFDDEFSTNVLLREFKSINAIEHQLKYILSIIYSLDAKSKEIFSADTRKLERLLNNQRFLRNIRYRDSLVTEYSMEYYGRDYGEDDPFKYNDALERQIQNLSMELMRILGSIIQVVKETSLFVRDET